MGLAISSAAGQLEEWNVSRSDLVDSQGNVDQEGAEAVAEQVGVTTEDVFVSLAGVEVQEALTTYVPTESLTDITFDEAGAGIAGYCTVATGSIVIDTDYAVQNVLSGNVDTLHTTVVHEYGHRIAEREKLSEKAGFDTTETEGFNTAWTQMTMNKPITQTMVYQGEVMEVIDQARDNDMNFQTALKAYDNRDVETLIDATGNDDDSTTSTVTAGYTNEPVDMVASF